MYNIINMMLSMKPMTTVTLISHTNNLEFDSLAHDKDRLVLLMSLVHFPHHFQQRQYLWMVISGPLLEVKGCNLQMSRVALRECIYVHGRMVKAYSAIVQ